MLRACESMYFTLCRLARRALCVVRAGLHQRVVHRKETAAREMDRHECGGPKAIEAQCDCSVNADSFNTVSCATSYYFIFRNGVLLYRRTYPSLTWKILHALKLALCARYSWASW